MLVQFGNNWIQKKSSDSQIGLGLRPRPILAVLGIFYIQLFPNWTACSPITYTNSFKSFLLLVRGKLSNTILLITVGYDKTLSLGYFF